METYEFDFYKPLGDAVKQARGRAEISQTALAELLEINERTVLNIENYRGNPKMQILYPLVRVLNIDPMDIFYPERCQDRPALRQLQSLLSDCREQEAELLIPVCKTILTELRKRANME